MIILESRHILRVTIDPVCQRRSERLCTLNGRRPLELEAPVCCCLDFLTCDICFMHTISRYEFRL